MRKILLCWFIVLLIGVVAAYATPFCNMPAVSQYGTNNTNITVSPSFECSNSVPMTGYVVKCAGDTVANSTLNSTLYRIGFSKTLVPLTTYQCSINVSQAQVFNFSLSNVYAQPPAPAFAMNSCPSNTSDVVLYLGILGFFTTIILFCIKQRMGIIGIVASFSLLAYSWMIVGCFVFFGTLFMGIGLLFLLYFGFGKYGG